MPGRPAAPTEMRPIYVSHRRARRTATALRHHIGPGGAGHFVKMVHNGIEYGDMQLICEAYALFQAAWAASHADAAGRHLRPAGTRASWRAS
jgi:6-phosphogluconate dehydrogenase